MRREWLMDKRGIILLLLAIVFAGIAECMATNIPPPRTSISASHGK